MDAPVQALLAEAVLIYANCRQTLSHLSLRLRHGRQLLTGLLRFNIVYLADTSYHIYNKNSKNLPRLYNRSVTHC